MSSTSRVTDLGIATGMAMFLGWPLEELIANGQLDVSQQPGQSELRLTRLDTGQVIVIKGERFKGG